MNKTHKQLDQMYIDTGIFTKEEINGFNNEFENTLSNLLNCEVRAKSFLKYKMGLIRYFFWSINPIAQWIELGKNNAIEKAKEYGFIEDWRIR